MDEQQVAAPSAEQIVAQRILQFLQAIFDEKDTILFRPIETWTENGLKKSRVLFRNTIYRACHPQIIPLCVPYLLKVATEQRANIFFGACPRAGRDGQNDLAWQIRTVRVLWADVDHVTVDEALARVKAAGLPAPSIVVNSGNGVHLYWILDEAFLIDDAGPSTPVHTEWIKTATGKKKPRKFIRENGDKVYLDQRRHSLRLSPKAQRVQDILTGVADLIGGDHTTDPARLLRLPFTFNRKDERNGIEPKPTGISVFEPSRRYPISLFEQFAKPSPEARREEQVAKMPLPQVRRASPSKSDKLSELVAVSAVAEAGTRSEADFAVCCYAVRNGIAKDEVWPQVEGIGKFAEQGRRYFDVTWENAEYDVRSSAYEKAQAAAAPVPALQTTESTAESDTEGGDTDEPLDGYDADDSRIIRIDTATTTVGQVMTRITDRLLAAGDCFHRSGQTVVVSGEQIDPILSTPELCGLLNQHVEFYFDGKKEDDPGEFKPLPSNYAYTWLNQRMEQARLPAIKLFSRNPVYTLDWRLVPERFDSESGIYYAGAAIEPREGTEFLDQLLKDFCFKEDGSRTNYVGLLLTTVLMPRFIGSKPAALFNGNQPGLGKTILAQIIATLRDGRVAETVTYNPNDEEFEKRLGALVRRGATTIIVDNAKSGPRGVRIDSAVLERSITDPVLSFRLLGQSEQIRAENSHIFCITANSADVSRDLVTRSVVVNLYWEGDPNRRDFSIDDPECFASEHRTELLGELLGMVERWKAAGMPVGNARSRFNKRGWGQVIGGILAHSGFDGFLENARDAATELDDSRRDFSELVAHMAPLTKAVWTAAELGDLALQHQLFDADLRGVTTRALATRMGLIASRYVAERFPISKSQSALFIKQDGRKGKEYRVELQAASAEMPNV